MKIASHNTTRAARVRLHLTMMLSLLLSMILFSMSYAQDASAVTPRATDRAGSVESSATTRAPRKMLLMHYLAWYETPSVRKKWGTHWTGPGATHNPDKLNDQGWPDVWSHMNPLIGPYDSTDPDVLECQLLQMKLAGVDGVIVDWYGKDDFADYRSIHDASQKLFDETAKHGFSFAVCYEDRTIKLMVERGYITQQQTPQKLRETFDWLRSNWFSKPNYFQLDSRPLVLNFGPVYIKEPAVWEAALSSSPSPGTSTQLSPLPRAAFFALHHHWKKAGATGGFTWVHKDDLVGDPDDTTAIARITQTYARVSSDPTQVIASAYPGFEDVYDQHHPTIDYRDGKTMRQTLAACMNGPWQLVQLVTWNDYGEGTCIEPTHQFGYQFLQIIQQARREELGPSFTFTADDLTLPARLLELRRSKKHLASELNAIAQSLTQGDTTQARAMLDKLDR